MAVLDFTSAKAPALGVVMPDGSRVEVLEPTRDLYGLMEEFEDGAAGRSLTESVDALLSLCAAILSNSSSGAPVSAGDVRAALPVSSCKRLLDAYWAFVTEQVAGSKN